MYFYLSFYNRLAFIFLVIFKRNTNDVIYLVNTFHHYTLYSNSLMIKNFELPSSYFLNLLHILKYGCYLFDRMFLIINNSCCYIYHFLQRNEKVALYIEQIEKDMEHYNIIYLSKRDEIINKIFKSSMSNILELVKNNHHQEKRNNQKYKKNIKGTINKLKKKK
jgi:hypothetical protein